MTDINKAIAFATNCLNWTEPSVINHKGCLLFAKGRFDLDPADILDIPQALEAFLGKRFFIQVNRGTGSLFKWRVIVGLQDLSASGSRHDHALGDSDDLYDAIFDACVDAARMFSQNDK